MSAKLLRKTVLSFYCKRFRFVIETLQCFHFCCSKMFFNGWWNWLYPARIQPLFYVNELGGVRPNEVTTVAEVKLESEFVFD